MANHPINNPCKKCGGLERNKSHACVACVREYLKQYRITHKDHLKDLNKSYYESNKQLYIDNARNYNKLHPEQKKRQLKAWYERNREHVKITQQAYLLSNHEKFAAKSAKRKAIKLRAIPVWANEFFIAEAYDLARLRSCVTGVKWEVDHIVPLQGKTVCGLHVENNLRVILKTINREKHNSYWPDMWEKI